MNVRELFRLDSKVAIVTGGSRGLGLWMAEGLAEAGADIVLCARKLAPCEEAAKAIREIGVHCAAFSCDVTDPAQVKDMVGKTLAEFGHIDILIYNAGEMTCHCPLLLLEISEKRDSLWQNSSLPRWKYKEGVDD